MIRLKLLALALTASAILAGGPALASGDAAKGKKAFSRCKACHSLEAGKNKVGPSLAGLMGRKAGTAAGYKFSADMVAAGEKGLAWDDETLKDYLKDPAKYVAALLGKEKAKVKMKNKFAKEDLRENLVAYLKEATK